MDDEATRPLYEVELRVGVHIVRRTSERASVEDLLLSLRDVSAQLRSAPRARGIVVDTADAPPTREREAFDSRVVPVLVSLISAYERRSVVVGSHAAALHTRRAGGGIKVFINDLEAAIKQVRSRR